MNYSSLRKLLRKIFQNLKTYVTKYRYHLKSTIDNLSGFFFIKIKTINLFFS